VRELLLLLRFSVVSHRQEIETTLSTCAAAGIPVRPV
jgi:hypothetical protein